MAKNVKKIINTEDDGSVSYKQHVVLSIVKLATQEISGVASLSAVGVPTLKRMFFKNYQRGIMIDFVDNNVYVDVFINVLFGYSVKDVAFRVQENIKSSIESMTEFKVDTINVNVMGVVFSASDEVAVM